ncbi:hypothetical protein JL720_4534 [Aureococcus anophagefferens]|nr:hypothetical protein JL720_4534 [Aureococcus anophagefferens]
MLPETRLDEFAAALQAPHAELQRRPAHANQYRYLQHLHVELLKVLFNDDGTDAWWPKPAKRHAGPESNLQPDFNAPRPPVVGAAPVAGRGEDAAAQRVHAQAQGARARLRGAAAGAGRFVAPPLAAARGPCGAPSPALVQLGQFLAAGQPPPPALLSRALQDMRYPPHVVALPMANQVLHPEIQAAVVAQARQAFAASCAMMNGGAGPTRARPSPPRPSPSRPRPRRRRARRRRRLAAPPAAPRRRRPRPSRRRRRLRRGGAAARGAARGGPGARRGRAQRRRAVPAAPPVKRSRPRAAPPVKAEPPAAPPRRLRPPRRSRPPRRPRRSRRPSRRSRRRRAEAPPSAAAPPPRPAATPAAAAASAGAAADGALASAAAARASASATSDEAAVARGDAATTSRREDAGRAAAARGRRRAVDLGHGRRAARAPGGRTLTAPPPPRTTPSARPGPGDFAPHRRPPGADAATRQHFEDAHRAVAEGREPPTDATKPAEEPKDEGLPLRGKESLAAAVDHLLAGGLYGMLAPKRRCALLRALVGALETKAVVKVLDDRARRLGSAEGALLQHRVRKKHEDYLKMRRAVSAARTDLTWTLLRAAAKTRPTTAGHFAAAQLGGLEASSTRGLCASRSSARGTTTPWAAARAGRRRAPRA